MSLTLESQTSEQLDTRHDAAWQAEREQTVSANTISERIDGLQAYRWTGERRQSLLMLFDGLPGQAPVVEIERRLEHLPDLVDDLTVAQWGVVCEAICPELYAQPRDSKKASAAVSGSFSKEWRLQERARNGLSLFHPRDSHGVEDGEQLELF